MNFDELKQDSETAKITTDFNTMFLESYVNASEVMKPQPIAISMGEKKYKEVYYPTPLGSYGDFSCLVGASKSGKTFLKSAIEATYLGGNSREYFPSMKAHDNMSKVVVAFDTEQSRFHTQRVVKRVIEMVGNDDGRYNTFSLRSYTAKERFQFIDWIVYESDFKGQIGLMSIDGFVDLLDDFNNLEESTALTQKLLEWTANGGMHCTGILHKNFGSEKPVGHIGSSILKKTETGIFIGEDGDSKTAEARYTRNIAFDNFSYSINKNNWLPYEDDNSKGEKLPKNKTVQNPDF
jgi:hypothetical protein